MRRIALDLIIICLCCIASLAGRAAPRYQLTDLGALTGYPFSRAYAINNTGQVVGQVAKVEPAIEVHAVIWENGKARIIESPKDVAYPAVHDINDAGIVAGGSELQPYGSQKYPSRGRTDQGFLWQNGTLVLVTEAIDDSVINYSHAYAINNRGQVAGTLGLKAAMWTAGKPTILPLPAGYAYSTAVAMNEQGDMAGCLITRDQKYQAALWAGGKVQPLGFLATHDQSTACAINDAGEVVGSSGKKTYDNTPFFWAKGKMTPLLPLDGRNWLNQALGINNHRQIVGYGLVGLDVHAALWEREDAPPIDLNTCIPANSGLLLMKAVAINDAGQIVGEARDAELKIHAVLLTPINE